MQWGMAAQAELVHLNNDESEFIIRNTWRRYRGW